MLKDLVVINYEEARAGTFLIAKGLEREHRIILEMVDKYKDRFLRLNEEKKFITNKITKKTAGRPSVEYLLNYNQVLLLFSLIRSTDKTLDFQECLIKQSNIAKAIELLRNMDIDDIPVRYVYAMQDDCGRVKIGISNNPNRRVKEIQAANGGKIDLIMVKQTKSKGYLEETKLHALCNDCLIHSEWFSQEAIQLIEEI